MWYDKYATNIFAKGFEYKNQKVDLITCFEVFEHFAEPLNEIEKLLKISNELIITTDLYSDKNIVPPKSWSYYTFDSGQHISFYSKKTFEYIAKKCGISAVCIVLLCIIINGFSANMSDIISLLTVGVSLVSTIIAIPLVITKSLFPDKENDQIVGVLTKLIDNDISIRTFNDNRSDY